MSIRIDQGFVRQLIEHPTFRSEISRLTYRPKEAQNPRSPSRSKKQSQQIELVVDEICEILSEEVRLKVERESLNMYESHLQTLKEIESLKEMMTPRTSASSPGKEINDFSLLSAINNEEELPVRHNKLQEQQGNSFAYSFLQDAGQYKEWEERINSTLSSLEEGMGHFEERIKERIAALENGVNRKMENHYRTLNSLMEHINDIQTGKVPPLKKEKASSSMRVEMMDQGRWNDTDKSRRKSFLGLFQYGNN